MAISLTDFFDAASRRHNDVILLPAIRRVSGNDFVPAGQCTGTLSRATSATVELLRQETLDFLALNLWLLNSPDLNHVDYEIWAAMQSRVNHRQIHSVDELRRRLIDVWCCSEQPIFDEDTDQWRGRHQACVHAKGGHFDYSLWTDNADFVHICYLQCELFDCYIFNNMKLWQQRWQTHSCSFYKVVH